MWLNLLEIHSINLFKTNIDIYLILQNVHMFTKFSFEFVSAWPNIFVLFLKLHKCA